MVSLYRCDGHCNTVEDQSVRICVPKKIEDSNLNVLNMITRANKPNISMKHISCNCIYEFE